MPITDYNKKKPLEVSSTNDSGTTQDKAQPILVKGTSTSSFDVSDASFSDSFDVSNQSSIQNTVVFSDSGDKMFTVGTLQDKVYEYSLSTSFDVTTASFTRSKQFAGGSFRPDQPTGLAFNSSGDKMYVLGDNNTAVYEYSLSTSFNVSTASFTSAFDVSDQDTDLKALAFSGSGDKMYVLGDDNTSVFEYSLSTSFDSNSASFTDSFDVSGQDSLPTGLAFSSSGDKMFVVGDGSNKVYEYSLSTSFDVTTASFTDSFDVSSQDTKPAGVDFSSSGDKMYVLGDNNDSVNEYSIGRSESKTGTGDIVIDFTNISDAQDIAVYDQNGNMLDYEIESLDTSAETGVIWAYDSWVRDDTVQAQIAYGNNSANTDRQNVTGVWTNDGADIAYHFNNATDSTGNSTATVGGAVQTSNGQFNGAYSFDGTDDYIETDYNTNYSDVGFTVVTWFKNTDVTNAPARIVNKDESGGNSLWRVSVNDTNSSGTNNAEFVIFSGSGNSTNNLNSPNLTEGEWYLVVGYYDGSNNNQEAEMFFNDTSIGTETSGPPNTDDQPLTFGATSSVLDQNFAGEIDNTRYYQGIQTGGATRAEWVQAEYDASPKGGQVYFSQQAAEATVTDQTVTVPETTTSSTNPNPQINATVDISIPTTTATAVNPNPTVSPGAAALNLTATTASTANPDFTVQPGNSTVQTPVSTSTVSNPDPQVNAFNEITVPETNVATVNPAPTLTVGQTIITPETTVSSSNPDLTVQPGETSLNISTTQISATNPEFGLNRQIVVGVATNLSSENPEPNLQPGLVSVQVPETSILTDNPALQLQPGATILQIERPTNLETVNPDFNTVSGAAELQVSETQLTASLQEPSIGLTLEFVSPTNALITNDERFFDMPDHTFTEGDLGDTLQAVLKTDSSPDGVDLTGATEIKLVVKDRDGVKVFDKEMSISDSSTGQVEYKWNQGDFIEEPGVYRAKIKVFDSTGEPESFPNDDFRTIEVEEEIS